MPKPTPMEIADLDQLVNAGKSLMNATSVPRSWQSNRGDCGRSIEKRYGGRLQDRGMLERYGTLGA